MTQPKTKTSALRERLVARDGELCHYCREKYGATLDHVYPRSLGGQLTDSNVVLACSPCNTAKADWLSVCFCDFCKSAHKAKGRYVKPAPAPLKKKVKKKSPVVRDYTLTDAWTPPPARNPRRDPSRPVVALDAPLRKPRIYKAGPTLWAVTHAEGYTRQAASYGYAVIEFRQGLAYTNRRLVGLDW